MPGFERRSEEGRGEDKRKGTALIGRVIFLS
jgi:hypothetical protein